MISKLLAFALRIKPRFEKLLFDLHITHNLTIATRLKNGKHIAMMTLHRTDASSQNIVPDIPHRRAYNTQTKQWEDMDV